LRFFISLTTNQDVTHHPSYKTESAATHLESVNPTVGSLLAAGTLRQYLLK
jgi:hypothetical protein